MARILLILFIIGLQIQIVSPQAKGQSESDTLETTLPVAPQRGLGEKLLDVPETIIKLPLYVGKGLSWAVINGIYRNDSVHRLAGYAFSFRPAGGVVPVVSFGSNAGWRFGLAYVRMNLLQQADRARWVASYSTNKYSRLEMSYSSPQAFSQRLGLATVVSYRSRPRESFFGLGNDSQDTNRVAFTMERTLVQLLLPWRFAKNLNLEFGGSFSAYRISDGESTDRLNSLPEIESKLSLSHADFRSSDIISGAVILDHDWRNNKGQPTSGGREQLELRYNHGVGNADDIKTVVAEADISHYLNIYHKRLLAMRVIARSVNADDEKVPVLPFYLKSNLGGRDNLRGFLNNRFVDYDMTMATVEYRWPIWSMIDAFVFAEAGRTYSSLSDEFTLRNWHEGFGTGLRIWREDNVLVSFQVAFSDEERRIYLELGGEW